MKKSDTKIRVIVVEKLLRDNPKGMTVKQILFYLELQFNITADRKSIYDDICVLTLLYDVQKIRKGSNTVYVMR
ncbi:MAG: hypothetical protein J6Q94_01085 [Clostridia bacterium]|nr:hypothetical protein [Clostridia bacterium]